MKCTECNDKICRKQANSCEKESFSKIESINTYTINSNCEIIKASFVMKDLVPKQNSLKAIQTEIEKNKI